MSEQSSASTELIYKVEDRPPIASAAFGALQHVLASFVGIITPSLIIGGVLGLGEHIPYLISMALMVSGVGTFIHAKRVGPWGSRTNLRSRYQFRLFRQRIGRRFCSQGKRWNCG